MNRTVVLRISLLLRLFLGGLLILSAKEKLLHPFEFSMVLYQYRVFSEGICYWIAVFLPFFEVTVGSALIAGLWRESVSWGALLLYSIFFLMVFQASVRGLNIQCGCFDVDGDRALDASKVIESVVLFILALSLVVIQMNSLSISVLKRKVRLT
jgi:uncharacterized membrane protein YphA (DoxX/SURF4 family)